jgi:hypothetical protein
MPTTSENSERRRARITKLMSDPRYWDETHPEHAKVFAESQQAFREAYPEVAGDDRTRPTTVHVRAYTRVQDGKEIEVSAYDRTQEIALHVPNVEGLGIPDYLRDIAEGPIHKREKADIVQLLRAHGDVVETEIPLTTITGMTIIVDVFTMSPERFLNVIEVKTPGHPNLSPNQLMVYPFLDLGNHVFSTDSRIRLFGFEPGQLLPPICAHKVFKRPGQPRQVYPLSAAPECQPPSH